MGQMKLSATQKKAVSDAYCCICNMCSWEDTHMGAGYWHGVKFQLTDMLTHGTTDGKPYVEPQPEIGEGYRVAKDNDVDRGRYDREGWVECEWKRAGVGHTVGGITYRVPVDRIPTDDDAKQRPEVMVRDNGTSRWSQKKLIAVTLNPDFPFVVVKDECHSSWRYCRFPYPGE